MAEVFQAKLYGSDGFEKDLVIKQILPQYARDPEFVQSFVAEAKIAVTLNHSNIVGIYELGRVDGTYFIAMEFVHGLDVFSLIDAARRHGWKISIGSSLLIAEEVAKGLDYAHRKVGPDGLPLGLVHRDLNPRNVLISTEGDVKILDFGIAKTASQVAAMPKTRAGVVKGTTGYMSPEQATGREIDSRTDIYQGGLLLFELLTGRALFWRPDDQETRELMRQHRVVAPSKVVDGISPEIDQLVIRCLERDPNKRFQTAAELAQEVGRVRISLHSDANHRGIGDQVAELMRLETVEEVASEKSLPSTQELEAVISNAIEHSISGDIITIATRVPSGIVAPKLPITGSRPLEMAVPVTVPAPGVVSAPQHEFDPVPTMPPQQRKQPALLMIAGIAAFALVGLSALYEMQSETPVIVVEKESTPIDAGEMIAEITPDAGASPLIDEPPPQAPPVKAKPEKRKELEPEAFGTVSFGTRSCSSRVSVDGRVIARSTPSYDHRLPPGEHRVVVEGISCPAIEQPGSLKRTTPTVVATIQVDAGASMKVIADFEHDQLIVRGN